MKWLYGLLCLFFLILFHEFGHFLAAKLFGVKVESFSVGFGPILIHKKIHGTDYRISLFPLGGYCGMKGEKDFQNAIEAKLPQIEGEKDSLYGIHPLKRALIGFAGPFFNFFFAFIAYSLISGIGYKYYTYSNSILINENITSSVAKDAGLESGDIITSINGKVTNDFSDLIQEISVRPDEDLILTVDRNGQNLSFNLHSEMDKATGSGKIGIAADTSKILEKESNKYSFFPALGHGFLESYNSVILTIKSICLLFKGVDLDNAVSGPARVTEMLGTTVKEGFSAGLKQGLIALLSLMAIISISLFIMNLLPIPILDGGLILIAIIEFVFHKKINPKIQYYIQFIGLAFIALLFIIGLQGDIKYFLNKN
ncbi:MAG: site-2 protease family protein [Treponema sp.]|nr:site-2 protease family protein [Treponema sp.]